MKMNQKFRLASDRTISLLLSTLLFSKSIPATARPYPIKMVQQPTATLLETNTSNFEENFVEDKLFENRTKQSLQQAITKYNQSHPNKLLAQNPTAPTPESERQVIVAEVVVKGVEGKLQEEVYKVVITRPGKTTTRSQLQQDINAIFDTGFFANVKVVPEDTPLGVRVTFEVEPNPILHSIKVEGNKVLPQNAIEETFSKQYGKILNFRQLQEGIKQLNKWYQDNGYALAQFVNTKVSPDGTVTLEVAEGIIQEIRVSFLNKDKQVINESGEPIWGRTRELILKEKIKSKAGDVFKREAVQGDLQQVFGLGIFGDVQLSLIPGNDSRQVILIVNAMVDIIPSNLVSAADKEVEAVSKESDKEKKLASQQQAISKYELAALLYAEQGDREQQAAMLRKIGEIYASEIELLTKDNQNVSDLATTLCKNGELDPSQIESWLKTQQFQQVKDPATTLSQIGNICAEASKSWTNQPQQLENQSEIAALANESQLVGDRLDLNLLINKRDPLDKKQKAIAYFNQALLILRETKNPLNEAQELFNIGENYQKWNEPKKALEYFNQALTLVRDINSLESRWVEISLLNELGLTYYDLGDFQTALNYIKESVSSLEKVENSTQNLSSGSFAWSCEFKRKNEKSQNENYWLRCKFKAQFYKKAQPLSEAEKQKNSQNLALYKSLIETSAFFNLGKIYESLGEEQLKIDSFNKALSKIEELIPLALAETDKEIAAILIPVIYSTLSGFSYYLIGDKQQAITSLQKAISMFREALPKLLARTDKEFADAWSPVISSIIAASSYYLIGDKQQSIASLEEAISLIQKAPDRIQPGAKKEFVTALVPAFSSGISAIVYYLKDNKEQAIASIQTALNQAKSALPKLAEKDKKIASYASFWLSFASTLLSNAVGNKQQTAASIEEIVSMARENKELVSEVAPILPVLFSYLYTATDNKKKALISIEEIAPFLQKVEPEIAALIIVQRAKLLEKVGEKQRGIANVEESLSLLRESQKEPDKLARGFLSLAYWYERLNEKQQAIYIYQQAVSLYRERLKHLSKTASTIAIIGNVYRDLGNQKQAIAQYKEAASIYQKISDSRQEATMFHGIGEVYQELGEYQQAFNAFKQAATLFRSGAVPSEETFALNSIANLYHALGEEQQALNYYNQAQEMARKLGDRTKEAIVLANIGNFYHSLGKYQLALDYLQRSRQIGQTWWNQSQAKIIAAMSPIYSDIESIQKAQQAWKDWRIFDATTLVKMSLVLSDMDNKPQAIASFNQAVKLALTTLSASTNARLLFQGAILYEEWNEPERAIYYLKQALQLVGQSQSDRAFKADIFTFLGRLYSQLGDKQQALEYLNQALQLTKQIGIRSSEAGVLYEIAKIERDRHNLTQAQTQIEAALAIVEDLRTNAVGSELRTYYFASKQDYYQFYIDLLMQLHASNPSQAFDAKALYANEQSRARVLLELLTESKADIRQGVNPQLLEREGKLQQQLSVLEQQRVRLLDGRYTQAQIDTIEQEIANLLGQYRELQAEIRAASPNYAALTQPQPLTLSQIQQQVLDDETILLQYSLGEKHSYLWVVTKTSLTSYTLPPRAEIEAAAQEFYELLQHRSGSIGTPRSIFSVESVGDRTNPEAVTKLSQMLLKPAMQQLGNKRLIVVGDGALQYVPFSALPVPGSSAKELVPLIVNHEIVNLPSASTVAILRQETARRQIAPKAIAILADPVFSRDDVRVKPTTIQSPTEQIEPYLIQRSVRESDIKLRRLAGTRVEAETIMTLIPESERIQAFDFAANRTLATNPALSKYRIVHLATHGILNSINPELSGVVLSLFDQQGNPQNGFLRLHDIFNLNLPAELVVLSACQTGLGKAVKGEGMVGLTRGFMYAGAPRVMVSLWNVDDKGTSELIIRFYKKMWQENKTPAAALRAAQIEMWQDKRWNAPYYWAAFTLQGEWK
jgi:CHAT domain-containing protein